MDQLAGAADRMACDHPCLPNVMYGVGKFPFCCRHMNIRLPGDMTTSSGLGERLMVVECLGNDAPKGLPMLRSASRRRLLAAMAAFVAFGPGGIRAEPPPHLRRWTCTNQDCDPYVYDPRLGAENVRDETNPIPPGVAFEDLPDDWICPVCGDPKSHFLPLSR